MPLIGRGFLLPNAEAYAAAGFGGGFRGNLYVSRVAAWLAAFEPIAAEARRISAAAPGRWAATARRFAHHFPDYRPAGDVWFLISLFDFDAFTRRWKDRQWLFVGVDGIAKMRGPDAPLSVLFSHELFHLYQAQVSGDPVADTVGLRLWREGLAAYVSALLNPDASLADALLSEELARADAATVAKAAGEALRSLRASDPQSLSRLFDRDYRGDLPARSGYLLGYKVAAATARRARPRDLARLPSAEVYRLVTAELERLAGPARMKTAV